MGERGEAEEGVGPDADETLLTDRDDVGVAGEQVPHQGKREDDEELGQHGQRIGVEQPGPGEAGDDRRGEDRAGRDEQGL